MPATTYETFTGLFNLFMVLAIIVGSVVLGIMVYLIIRHRDRPSVPDPEDTPTLGSIPPERGKVKTLLVSVGFSTIVLSLLIFGTFGAVDNLLNPPEKGSLEVKVVGFRFNWKFVYPNGQEVRAELRVPAGEVIKLSVTGQDVFHNFGIYDFKIKTDAIPGRTNHIWFVAHQPGEYTIQCFEFCGLGHATMISKLIVMEPEEFKNWYSGLEVKA